MYDFVMPVCVGPNFKINADKTLGILGPRAGEWTYTGLSLPNASNFRLDNSLGLWAEPPDIRFSTKISDLGSVSVNLTSGALATLPNAAAFTITNSELQRTSLLLGTATWSGAVVVASGTSQNGIFFQGNFAEPPQTYTTNETVSGSVPSFSWSTRVQLTWPVAMTLAPATNQTLTPTVKYQVTNTSTSSFLSAWWFEFTGTLQTVRTVP